MIFLYLLLIAPKLLFDRVVRGKRHPEFLQRIGFRLPSTSKPLIWFHAVSVGEVKAGGRLFKEMQALHPEAFFLITTDTATGQEEAKRSLPTANAYAYLPLDFSWVVKRWIRKLNPKIFILVESGFWPNLLSTLKKNKTKIILVSGRMSERSFQRFRFFSRFAKKLFSHFDLICLQNEEQKKHFIPFVNSLYITGNLKFDLDPQAIDLAFWRQKLQLPSNTITISCTHAPEEEELLSILDRWFLILAPRHPERFEQVAQLLARKQIPFFRWSGLENRSGNEKVMLLDAMGQLPICYSLSRLAIVGGSFVNHVGGHNLLEPCLYGIPVLFGPNTQNQSELARLAIQSGAGIQSPLSDLPKAVEKIFSQEQALKAAATHLMSNIRGSTKRTLDLVQRVIS